MEFGLNTNLEIRFSFLAVLLQYFAYPMLIKWTMSHFCKMVQQGNVRIANTTSIFNVQHGISSTVKPNTASFHISKNQIVATLLQNVKEVCAAK